MTAPITTQIMRIRPTNNFVINRAGKGAMRPFPQARIEDASHAGDIGVKNEVAHGFKYTFLRTIRTVDR